MSDESAFAPPPFHPANALTTLKRQLRDLRLTERGAAFELKGHRVVALETTPGTIEARLVKSLARTPEWTTHTLRTSLDVRRFADLVKQQLARWEEE